MGFQGLSANQQLLVLAETNEFWKTLVEGQVCLYPGRKCWIEVGFSVQYFRVLISVIVGPKGGVTEQVTILDDRDKDAEIDHLFLIQTIRGSSQYLGHSLIGCKIGRGTREEKIVKIVELLKEAYQSSQDNQEEYVQKLQHLQANDILDDDLYFWRAGLPRT